MFTPLHPRLRVLPDSSFYTPTPTPPFARFQRLPLHLLHGSRILFMDHTNRFDAVLLPTRADGGLTFTAIIPRNMPTVAWVVRNPFGFYHQRACFYLTPTWFALQHANLCTCFATLRFHLQHLDSPERAP